MERRRNFAHLGAGELKLTSTPESPESSARQLACAAIGFLLPLAIFFGWFFLFRSVSFKFVLAALLFLIVFSLFGGARFKDSRALRVGATWLFVGCLGALFWALLINGMS